MKEDLIDYSNGASKNLLDTLRGQAEKDEKPHVEVYYLTKDGIVLTHFANDGTPAEINVPLKNLQKFLKIKSWKSNESIQLSNEKSNQ